LVLVGSVGTLALGAGPALATPCWKRLINDWWDGQIDNVYPIACYRAAMANAPEDLQAYSDLRSDLRRALAAATALHRRGNTFVVPADTGGSQGGGETGRSGRDAAPPTLYLRRPTQTMRSSIAPVHGHTSAVPIPLIALGAIGLLLLVAGA